MAESSKSNRWSLNNIGMMILFIFMFTTSGYALSIVNGFDFYYFLLLPITIMLLCILKRGIFLQTLDLFGCVYLLLMLASGITCLLVPNNFIYTMKFILTVTFSFLFVINVSFADFKQMFIVFMRIITLASLVLHFSINIFGTIPPLPLVTNINNVNYYNGFIAFAFAGYGIDRNTGIFWEPGIFSSFLILALVFVILDSPVKRKRFSVAIDVVLFAIGIVTTNSTAGYLLFFLVLTLFFFRNRSITVGTVVVLTVALVLFFVMLINLNGIIDSLVEWNPRVFRKLVEENDSFTARAFSPIVNLQIFGRSPIFGVGLAEAGKQYAQLTTSSQTSTITYWMASFGLFGVAFVGIACWSVLRYRQWNPFARIIFLVIIAIITNKEPHTFFTATYILLFYFIRQRSLDTKGNRVKEKLSYEV